MASHEGERRLYLGGEDVRNQIHPIVDLAQAFYLRGYHSWPQVFGLDDRTLRYTQGIGPTRIGRLMTFKRDLEMLKVGKREQPIGLLPADYRVGTKGRRAFFIGAYPFALVDKDADVFIDRLFREGELNDEVFNRGRGRTANKLELERTIHFLQTLNVDISLESDAYKPEMIYLKGTAPILHISFLQAAG